MTPLPSLTQSTGRFASEPGAILLPSVLAGPAFNSWTSMICDRCQAIELLRAEHGPVEVSRSLSSGHRFVATASSFTLGAALSQDAIQSVLAMIATRPAGDWIRAGLGPNMAFDLDQAWVRRQYAPARYPPLHAPHGWHQDGALGFDFLSPSSQQLPDDALLDMVTCWIALDPCGVDAPGLELVINRIPRVIAPVDLAPECVSASYPSDAFWRPCLLPGDAVLFHGDILHRTYVTPSMAQDRTSIELRFFPARNLPDRLARDHFLSLPAI